MKGDAGVAFSAGGHAGKMSEIPADLRYSQDHLWARRDAGTGRVRVGITDFAQQSLGDVVDVTLPRLGDTVTAGQACGDIESTKSVNDLVAPVSGTVGARNDDLGNSPDLVNADPYGRGWMFDIDADPSALDGQLAGLLDASAYGDVAGS
jgi:glycine cleavage system H protein